MIDWRGIPASLWAYTLLTTSETALVAFTVSAPTAPLLFFFAFTLIWNFFLLRGVRWLWIATIALFVVSLAVNLASGSGTWLGAAIGLVELSLLLLPSTRRFFSGSRRHAVSGAPTTATEAAPSAPAPRNQA